MVGARLVITALAGRASLGLKLLLSTFMLYTDPVTTIYAAHKPWTRSVFPKCVERLSPDWNLVHSSQVEQVAYTKAGRSSIGTLHLTAHHLIFHYNEEDEDKELWVGYGVSFHHSMGAHEPMTGSIPAHIARHPPSSKPPRPIAVELSHEDVRKLLLHV